MTATIDLLGKISNSSANPYTFAYALEATHTHLVIVLYHDQAVNSITAGGVSLTGTSTVNANTAGTVAALRTYVVDIAAEGIPPTGNVVIDSSVASTNFVFALLGVRSAGGYSQRTPVDSGPSTTQAFSTVLNSDGESTLLIVSTRSDSTINFTGNDLLSTSPIIASAPSPDRRAYAYWIRDTDAASITNNGVSTFYAGQIIDFEKAPPPHGQTWPRGGNVYAPL